MTVRDATLETLRPGGGGDMRMIQRLALYIYILDLEFVRASYE